MSKIIWPEDTELVSIALELEATDNIVLPTNYNYYLHAWFLNQVRVDNPKLSAYLHDGQSEKPFTIAQLDGEITKSSRIQLMAGSIYQLRLTALCQPLCQWLALWLQNPPQAMVLNMGTFQILKIAIALPATTYNQLFNTDLPRDRSFSFSFLTPTGFRRKGHHLPLPVPSNIFHSYLRRWNDFSGMAFDQESFLHWIDEVIFVSDLDIAATKTTVGKRGSVTGFTGYVEFGIDRKAQTQPEFERLLQALIKLAPYCGTGHKTTFGLGQTKLGKIEVKTLEPPAIAQPIIPDQISPTQRFLEDRTAELTAIFMATKKRQGGDRAQQTATTWATIIARRETGESLQAIADDLQMPYLTVKSYVKLARRALKES